MADPTYPQPRNEFTQCVMDHIVAESFVERVEYHEELDSTNSRALQMARDEASLPGVTLILTKHQTAGRGRGENRWWSGPGALTFSLLLSGEHLPLSSGDWPKTSLVAGLAIGEAIEEFVPGERARLKWPNDVYLCGRKVCGILVEATSGDHGMVAIGIGVNVNNSFDKAPDRLDQKAIALRDVAQHEVARVELLVAILWRFESRLRDLGSGDDQWQQHWRQRCLLTGRTVELDAQGGRLVGTCHGIDEGGALVIETNSGLERCLSGVVVRFD
jgi:BirA family transcriptional regulator, biotin operon repressor / biotin---[acetyl-CoA-carboxylase] ligase